MLTGKTEPIAPEKRATLTKHFLTKGGAEIATAKRRIALLLALALAVVAYAAVAELAGATHPRPKGATPFKVSLVPTYNPCTAPNRTHGPPLAFPSCSPPAQTSGFVTVGTPDANGAAANSVGSIRIDVIVGVPGPPNDSDVIVTPQMTDVRCKAGTSSCGNANAAGGPDYTGWLQGNATITITDHFNAVQSGGGIDPATVVDIPWPMSFNCASTADTSIGAVCKVTTQCTRPDCSNIRDGDRTVVGITQLQVFDGGPDGIIGTPNGNTLFAVQGLFVP